MIKAIIALLSALPELLALIKTVQDRTREIELNNTVKENMKAIDNAFKTKDADALRKIFNS